MLERVTAQRHTSSVAETARETPVAGEFDAGVAAALLSAGSPDAHSVNPHAVREGLRANGACLE